MITKITALISLLVFSVAQAAEVIPIEPIEKCFLCNSEPSQTMYWQGQGSKAVLMLIPGGEGHIGLRSEQKDHRFHQFQTLKRLTDQSRQRGPVDVVLLDSPGPLSPNHP